MSLNGSFISEAEYVDPSEIEEHHASPGLQKSSNPGNTLNQEITTRPTGEQPRISMTSMHPSRTQTRQTENPRANQSKQKFLQTTKSNL